MNNLWKIAQEIRIIFEKNCRESPKNFGNIWGAFENLPRDVSEFNPALFEMMYFRTLEMDISYDSLISTNFELTLWGDCSASG